MKTIVLIGFALLMSWNVAAQTFTRAEYFFDNDPGNGNGTSIALSPSGETINFTAIIPTAALSPGFHYLGMRIQQTDLTWGLFELRGFYLSQSTSNAPDITGAEYFFDADPGQGNATAIPVTPGATVNFTIPVSTASLGTGFHFLTIRARSGGLWGNFESRGFYISTATTASADISEAEYFFDTDPGQGNATPITVPGGATSNFTLNLPSTGLSAGFHFLAIRAKSAGLWGNFETRGFYVSTSTNPAADITDAEYFFDTDPGVGNGIALSIPSGSNSSFTVGLPSTGLSPGFHVLAIRTKGSDGRWGLFETRSFYVASSIGNAADIVAAEYFIDTDPGNGNATPLTVSPTGATIIQDFTIATSASLAAGTHTLSIRVMDNDGQWSVHETVEFEVSVNNPPVAIAGADQVISLPVNGVVLDGSASTDSDGTIATYAWSQISGPTTASITDPGQPATNVEGLTAGIYEFQLEVTDNGNFSDTDIVMVTVNEEPNIPPVSNAGPDQVITLPLNAVSLSGASSSDPDGTISAFQWTKVSGPINFNILNAGQANTDVVGLSAGQYQFQLTVTDNRGATNSDIVQITVNETGCPPIPVITQTNDLLVCNPPGDSYKWFRNGEAIPDSDEQIIGISLTEYGTYTVELTDNGCSTTSAEFTYVITGAENSQFIRSVYPNPVHGTLYVGVGDQLNEKKISLIDIRGRKVLEQVVQRGENEISVEGIASGMYYLIIDGKTYHKIQKL